MNDITFDNKLSQQEAMSVQILANSPSWPHFINYLQRRNNLLTKECRTCKTDHRFHQGRAEELGEIVRIEEKANNILG